MKKGTKVLSIIGVSLLCIVALAVFFTFLFNKPGDIVYITALSGDVIIADSTDLNNQKPAVVGMTLTNGDIVLTGERAACVLSYEKEAGAKDNFINIGEKSQVHLQNSNRQTGYNYHVVYGSLICNMPNVTNIETSVSTKAYVLSTANIIAKADYDTETNAGKVYVFDGNPRLQIIQPSGSNGNTETLLKNSVCAVRLMDDGTVGFGRLNTGFGLDDFKAQDLQVMSGIANNWSERVSYSVSEFEQAFQSAGDHDYYVTTPATVGTLHTTMSPVEIVDDEPVDITTDASTETIEPVETVEVVEPSVTTSSSTTVVTTVTSSTTTMTTTTPATTTTTPAIAVTTPSAYYTGESPIVLNPSYSDLKGYYTVFTRPTLVELPDDEPIDVPDDFTDSAISTTRPSYISTTKPSYTQAPTIIKPSIPPAQVDTNASHTVVFTYRENENEYWAIQLVKHGDAAIAPDIPEIEGKHFVSWDTDFSCVTSDMTISGIFADGNDSNVKYTVNLYVSDKLWKTVSVKHGDSVKITDTPAVNGKTFVGWSDSLTNVTSDMTVFALFS